MITADGLPRKAWYNEYRVSHRQAIFCQDIQGVVLMPASRSQRRRQPNRAPIRRPVVRTPEPVDYSLDYYYVSRDLLRILLWGGLLFIGMIVVWFVI
jgi:hypothetical protein